MRVLRVRFKVQRVMVALAVVVLAPAGGQAHGQADPGRPGDSLKARLAVVQARQSKAAERYARELRGATTDLARAAAEARYEREFRQDVGPLLSLARVNPDDPAAVRALQFVVTTDYLGSRGEAEQAIEILTRDHVRHRRSGNYCGFLTNLF